MINVILAGVGGQGTVLAAKILAVAAASKGWKVRTAETIGMAQRGGSVVSHVRIANNGEDIHAPLVVRGTANLIIAFEPGEAMRALPYLNRSGSIIMATTPIEPVSATFSAASYDVDEMIEQMKLVLYNGSERRFIQEKAKNVVQPRLFTVNDAAIMEYLGGNRKVLNSVMLAQAVKAECLPITIEDLCNAVADCVKPAYVDMNINAIQTTLAL